MTDDKIISALETTLGPILLSTLKLKLKVAEDPDDALNIVGTASVGGLVILNPADDEALPAGKGTATTLTLNVTLAMAKGLPAHSGDDIHRERPNGRDSFMLTFRKVMALFRSVQFTNEGGFPCGNHLKYEGSEWLVTEDPAPQYRARVGRLSVIFCLDRFAAWTAVSV